MRHKPRSPLLVIAFIFCGLLIFQFLLITIASFITALIDHRDFWFPLGTFCPVPFLLSILYAVAQYHPPPTACFDAAQRCLTLPNRTIPLADIAYFTLPINTPPLAANPYLRTHLRVVLVTGETLTLAELTGPYAEVMERIQQLSQLLLAWGLKMQ